jgi:hypothetical protein
MSDPDFTIEISQNEYLPDGGRDISAVITVTSSGSAPTANTVPAQGQGPGKAPASAALALTAVSAGSAMDTSPAPSCAEIIIIDCSGSMNTPESKMNEVLRATAVAVNTLRDGVAFALIAGTERARLLYPDDGTMAIVGPRTKVAAKRALVRLQPLGDSAGGSLSTGNRAARQDSTRRRTVGLRMHNRGRPSLG